MTGEIIHFLLQVLASVCGILLGAAIANAVQEIRRKRRWKRERRNRR